MGACINSCVFLPPRRPYLLSQLPESTVMVATVSGSRIPVIFFPAPGSGRDVNARLTCIVSHGNAEDLRSGAGFGRAMAATWSCNVVVYDYTGYGCSEGGLRPSERRACDDIRAVHSHVVRALGVHEENIVLYGRSMGSGPTVYLASQVRVKGVILVSPLRSALRVVLPGWVVVGCLCFLCDVFPNGRRVRRISAPVLVMHGDRDGVVPFSHGKALHQMLLQCRDDTPTPLWVPGAGHNDMEEIAGERMNEAVQGFLRSLELRRV